MRCASHIIRPLPEIINASIKTGTFFLARPIHEMGQHMIFIITFQLSWYKPYQILKKTISNCSCHSLGSIKSAVFHCLALQKIYP
jgi:hypothetical protein